MLILARPLARKFSSSSVDGASARGDGGDLPTPTLVLPPAWKTASPLTVVAVFGMARTAAVGQLDELPVVKGHALGCSAASAGATLAGGGQGFRGGVGGEGVRANPATSAPSHICETWRNVAQTCLIIKEMGPERSRINVSDPI